MKNEKLSFYIDKKIVYVNIERTTNNNMYLRIKNDAIVVSAHRRISTNLINNFVQDNIEKFVKHLKEQKANKFYSLIDNYIWVSGIKLKIVTLTGFDEQAATINNKSFYIKSKNGTNAEAEIIVKDFLKQQTLSKIKIFQRIWEVKMEIPEHSFSATYKNTSWASNSLRRKNINYSSKLAHYNDTIINYVVIHELAHFVEPNHSQAFWSVVHKYEPNYKKIKNQLKETIKP